MKHIKSKLSLYVYVFCVAVMCYATFSFYPRWKQTNENAVISWDVSGYYWYLPSTFIFKDLKHQRFKDSILNHYRPTILDFQQAMPIDNGNYVLKYSSGMAVMYLPFFTAGHIAAGLLGYPRDGFSIPYQFAIQLGGFLIAILGLWYLRKLLLLFYRDAVVAIVFILVVIGSNYLNCSTVDNGMSHSWLFTVYVFLLLNTYYFYQSFKIKYAISIGLLVGLAALTRPSDIISCMIPLLWGMESISFEAIKKQFSLFIKNFRCFLLAATCASIVISIQLLYWKYVSGHWIVYSYNNQKLYFRSPNFMDYTFSYRSGWLTYSPMMLLTFAGIIPYLKTGKNKIAIIAFFLINYYVVCSWSIWWYGGRAMIQSYPVLIFPLAALVQAALNRKVLLWILTPFALVFMYFNLWMTWQYHRGKFYDNDCMNERYFWRAAGRWSVPGYTIELKDNPDLFEGDQKNTQQVYYNGFEDTALINNTQQALTGSRSLRLDKEHQNSPIYKFDFPKKESGWLRIQATFRCNDKEWEPWKMLQFIVRLKQYDTIVKENVIRVYRVLNEMETRDIFMDVKLPEQNYNNVDILFWNGESEKVVWIDELKAWHFKE